MRRLRALLPLLGLAALFLVVLAAGPGPLWRSSLPDEPFTPERCTWHCHNHGCRHRPSLPGWLTSDEGAFGRTIRGLYSLGGLLSRDRAGGYGAANLLVFCVGWPVLTGGLLLVARRQHAELERHDRERDERGRR